MAVRGTVARCSIAGTMTTPRSPQRLPSGSALRPIEGRDLAALGPQGINLDGDDFDIELDGYEPTLGHKLLAKGRRSLVRLSWLVLAAGIAFGSAGIATATQSPPALGSRDELTYRADQALSDRLDSAVRDLARLKDDVDSLGDMTRKMLSSLSQVNQLALKDATTHGDNSINAIDAGAAALNKSLDCASWGPAREVDLQKVNSQALIDRYHGLCVALQSVTPLRGDWDSLTTGSQTAMQVAGDISTHDSLTADALVLATQGRYPEALDKLTSASAAIADATAIGDSLSKMTDLSTLNEWMQRTKGMDDALRLLWQTMITSKGKVTAQVTAALKAVSDAKALLPSSSDVLQVVMYELAGLLTSDGISIETARGQLGDALTTLTATPSPH